MPSRFRRWPEGKHPGAATAIFDHERRGKEGAGLYRRIRQQDHAELPRDVVAAEQRRLRCRIDGIFLAVQTRMRVPDIRWHQRDPVVDHCKESAHCTMSVAAARYS